MENILVYGKYPGLWKISWFTENILVYGKYPGLWKNLLRLMNTVLMILSELITKLYELEYSPLLPRTLSVFPANPTRTFDT